MTRTDKILLYMATAAIFSCGFVVSTIATSFVAHSQPNGQTSNDALLKILPAITFIITTVIGILNLYLYKKIATAKEDVLKVVKSEMSLETRRLEDKIERIDGKVATKEQLDFLKREMALTLQSIEMKIDFTNRNEHNGHK